MIQIGNPDDLMVMKRYYMNGFGPQYRDGFDKLDYAAGGKDSKYSKVPFRGLTSASVR